MSKAWEPSQKPFMTVILTFEDEGGKTRYTARVRHWTVADREAHEKMGFHQGWGSAPTSSRRWSRSSEREKAHAVPGASGRHPPCGPGFPLSR